MEQLRLNQVPTCGATQGKWKCLVWGDSHAMALMPGIDAACKSQGILGFQATFGATPPILDFKCNGHGLADDAPAFNQAVFDFSTRNKIDIVILAGFWRTYAGDPEFEAQLGKTIDALTRQGIAVAIVLDVATHQDDVPAMLAWCAVHGESTRRVGVSLESHRARNRICDDVIRKVAAGQAIIVDTTPYFVDDKGLWRAELDGVAMYRDKGHLSTEGSLRLKKLFEELFRSIVKHRMA